MYELMKVALIQMDSVLGDKDKNTEHALFLAKKAVKEGSNLLVFPEMFNTGYELSVLGPDMNGLSETDKSHETVDVFMGFAKENLVDIIFTIPYFHTNRTGKPNISSFYVDSKGEIKAIQDKNHLFGDEKIYFETGSDYPVFDTRFGKVGMMVCYDANFPEPARILTLEGALCIFCTAAWRAQDIRLFDMIMPQRAAEEVSYVVACNRFGIDNGRYCPGHSQICSPEGKILNLGAECEEIIYQEIRLDKTEDYRENIPYLNDLLPIEIPKYLNGPVQ